MDLTLIIIHYNIFYLSYITSKKIKILGTTNKIHHIFGHTSLANFFQFTLPGMILRCLNLDIFKSKSFEISQPQSYKRSSFDLGWLRGTGVYNTSLSPCLALAMLV